jgi:hypothetical protein
VWPTVCFAFGSFSCSSLLFFLLIYHVCLLQTAASPITSKSVDHMDMLWRDLTHKECESSTTLTVNGRLWTLPRTAHGMARCTFEELCDRVCSLLAVVVVVVVFVLFEQCASFCLCGFFVVFL